jgi:hypothetical protein
MIAAEPYSWLSADLALTKHELLEIHHSKISLHRAKADYSYPAIRLPYRFSKLAGLSASIYQTVHKGALAFLVVVSSSNKGEEKTLKKSENFATSSKPSYLHGENRRFKFGRAHSFFASGGRNRDG